MTLLEKTRRILWSLGVADAVVFFLHSLVHPIDDDTLPLFVAVGWAVLLTLILDATLPDPTERHSPWDDR